MRANRLGGTDPFGNGLNSAEAYTEELFDGDLRGAKSETIKARPTHIFEILPDPTQPRRAIPSTVRGLWTGDVTPEAMTRLFADWLALAQQESGGHLLPIEELLKGEEIVEDVRGPITATLLALTELAGSIQRDGLTNPITVVKTPSGFQIIETGERRWLAFHLLYSHTTGDAQWAKIPARTVDTFSRFRQAAENTQRGDLTAVGKVRQYALLLMELRQQVGDTFEPYNAFDHDRDFYAQVANRYAPDGKNELLLSACGIKTKSTASKYRSVLELNQQQWTIADDEGLSFDAIKGRFAVTNSPSAQREKASPAVVHISQLKRMQKAAKKYAPHEREELKQTLRQWLDQLESND